MQCGKYYLKNREKILERSKIKKSLENQRNYQTKIKQEKKEDALLINEQFIKDNNLVEHSTLLGYYGTVDGKVFSNKGSYRSLRKLNPTIQKNNNGYACLSLYVNKKRIQIYHHRFIAEIFLPNPNNFPQVNHVDEDKCNNSVSNLEWCDAFHNMQHSLSKHYKLKNIKTGEEEIVFNLKRWCEQKGYNPSSMVSVAKKRSRLTNKMTKNGIKQYHYVYKVAYGYEVEECEVSFK